MGRAAWNWSPLTQRTLLQNTDWGAKPRKINGCSAPTVGMGIRDIHGQRRVQGVGAGAEAAGLIINKISASVRASQSVNEAGSEHKGQVGGGDAFATSLPIGDEILGVALSLALGQQEQHPGTFARQHPPGCSGGEGISHVSSRSHAWRKALQLTATRPTSPLHRLHRAAFGEERGKTRTWEGPPHSLAVREILLRGSRRRTSFGSFRFFKLPPC